MYISKEEEKALAGELGEYQRVAMSLLVDIGDFYNADRLIDVKSAHISGVSYLTGGDGLIDQLEYFVKLGAKVKIFSTLNPSGMDREAWKSHYIDLNFSTKQFKILRYFEDMGVTTTCSCTPYDFGHILTLGQHVAWAESSAITFANSFFGARTNKEDALTVLAAALTGKTIYYGFHKFENRLPNVGVKVEKQLSTYSDYSILGEIIGKEFNNQPYPFGAIPYITGIDHPRPHQLKGLGAALASFGTHLFHIHGHTPETQLFKIEEQSLDDNIIVTPDMIKDTYEQLAPVDEIPDIAVIGCPNANYEEMELVYKHMIGKKLRPNKEFWLFTNRAQKAIAESSGLLQKLVEKGVKVLVDTCPEVTPYDKSRFTSILTNSIKAQHYISAPQLNGLPTFVLPLEKCVEVMFV